MRTAPQRVVLAVAGLGLLRLLWFHFVAERPLPIGVHAPAPIDARYAALRGLLPKSGVVGVVGFVTDAAPRTTLARRLYGEALYALAPLQLVPGDGTQAVVVASVTSADALGPLCARLSLRPVRSFGLVALLERRR